MVLASMSIEELTVGNARSASTTARETNGRYDSEDAGLLLEPVLVLRPAPCRRCRSRPRSRSTRCAAMHLRALHPARRAPAASARAARPGRAGRRRPSARAAAAGRGGRGCAVAGGGRSAARARRPGPPPRRHRPRSPSRRPRAGSARRRRCPATVARSRLFSAASRRTSGESSGRCRRAAAGGRRRRRRAPPGRRGGGRGRGRGRRPRRRPPAAAPGSPMRASGVPTGTVSPRRTRISSSTPSYGLGISESTLSVDTSNSGSSNATGSPTCFEPACRPCPR